MGSVVQMPHSGPSYITTGATPAAGRAMADFQHPTKPKPAKLAMFNRTHTKGRKGRPSISWPVESGRPGDYGGLNMQKPLPDLPELSDLSNLAGPEPLNSVPSLSSGSDSSRASSSISTGSGTSRRASMIPSTMQRHSTCSETFCTGVETNLMSPDKPPTQEQLDLAGGVPIYDADGNSRPFASLYEGPLAIGEQQLVIFVRHFFCGACQAYLRALSNAISMKTYFTLPIPTSITIIGLGSPALIPHYRSYTGTPFPIFTDPTRRLHKLLGMGWSLNMGARPQYFNKVNEISWIAGQLKQMKRVEEKEIRMKGGAWWWVGGEFLIREGRIVWAHKMRNYRDHVEMEELKRLVGAE